MASCMQMTSVEAETNSLIDGIQVLRCGLDREGQRRATTGCRFYQEIDSSRASASKRAVACRTCRSALARYCAVSEEPA